MEKEKENYLTILKPYHKNDVVAEYETFDTYLNAIKHIRENEYKNFYVEVYNLKGKITEYSSSCIANSRDFYIKEDKTKEQMLDSLESDYRKYGFISREHYEYQYEIISNFWKKR